MRILIGSNSATRFVGGHRETGLWWFRIFGYGLHYKDLRLHRPLFSERNRRGQHRFDRQIGPYLFGVLLP